MSFWTCPGYPRGVFEGDRTAEAVSHQRELGQTETRAESFYVRHKRGHGVVMVCRPSAASRAALIEVDQL